MAERFQDSEFVHKWVLCGLRRKNRKKTRRPKCKDVDMWIAWSSRQDYGYFCANCQQHFGKAVMEGHRFMESYWAYKSRMWAQDDYDMSSCWVRPMNPKHILLEELTEKKTGRPLVEEQGMMRAETIMLAMVLGDAMNYQGMERFEFMAGIEKIRLRVLEEAARYQKATTPATRLRRVRGRIPNNVREPSHERRDTEVRSDEVVISDIIIAPRGRARSVSPSRGNRRSRSSTPPRGRPTASKRITSSFGFPTATAARREVPPREERADECQLSDDDDTDNSDRFSFDQTTERLDSGEGRQRPSGPTIDIPPGPASNFQPSPLVRRGAVRTPGDRSLMARDIAIQQSQSLFSPIESEAQHDSYFTIPPVSEGGGEGSPVADDNAAQQARSPFPPLDLNNITDDATDRTGSNSGETSQGFDLDDDEPFVPLYYFPPSPPPPSLQSQSQRNSGATTDSEGVSRLSKDAQSDPAWLPSPPESESGSGESGSGDSIIANVGVDTFLFPLITDDSVIAGVEVNVSPPSTEDDAAVPSVETDVLSPPIIDDTRIDIDTDLGQSPRPSLTVPLGRRYSFDTIASTNSASVPPLRLLRRGDGVPSLVVEAPPSRWSNLTIPLSRSPSPPQTPPAAITFQAFGPEPPHRPLGPFDNTTNARMTEAVKRSLGKVAAPGDIFVHYLSATTTTGSGTNAGPASGSAGGSRSRSLSLDSFPVTKEREGSEWAKLRSVPHCPSDVLRILTLERELPPGQEVPEHIGKVRNGDFEDNKF